MSVGFNVPQNPLTTIRASVHLGGSSATTINNDLRSLSGDVDAKTVFIELRVGVKAGTAQGHADTLSDIHTSIRDLKLDNEYDQKEKDEHMSSIRKVYASDDSTVSIVVAMPQKIDRKLRNLAIPDDVLNKLAHIGNSVSTEIDLGTSLQEIIDEGKPIIEQLMKGFRFKVSLTAISNLKKALMALSKNEEHQDKFF